MKQRMHVSRVSLVLTVFLVALLCAPALARPAQADAGQPASVSIFAGGLDNPRGLKFGPDGNLYVAEGGTGGSITTAGQCPQVVAPIGPYTGGMTARISKIDAQGQRSTVVDNLPSSQTSPASGSLVSGVADVAFVKGQLYALLAGAGCSHGLAGIDNGVIQVDLATGAWTMLADLSTFLKDNQVANPEPDDFEPDGTFFSMVAAHNDLFVVEPNHGEVDRVTLKGELSRVIDISASQGHIVPTAIDYYLGRFFVGNLTTFPLVQGAAPVMQINDGGYIQDIQTGFTNIVGVLHDDWGNMYVLEDTVGSPMPAPGLGKIVRVSPDGSASDLVNGLTLPTAMTFGPDGNIYVSAQGLGFPQGAGEIVKVTLGN